MTDPQITALLQEILAVSQRNQQLLEQLAGQPSQNWAQPQASAPQDSFGINPRILDLIARGQKIQAIKLYREDTGTGLAEAKEAIEQIERDMR